LVAKISHIGKTLRMIRIETTKSSPHKT